MPPGETARPWPPISSTLISGERDAVLVDTPITVEQSRALVNWLVARGQESDDDIRHIHDFERLVMQTTTARELYDEMLRLYPDWINRGALWSSVLAVKPLM